MTPENSSTNDGTAQEPSTHAKYQPPRVVKSRRLTEVTGQGAAVPSGAPRAVVE